RLTWNDVDETDTEYYEVRTEDANWGVKNSAFVDRSKRLMMTDKIAASGSVIYYIKAIDSSGHYSTNAAIASASVDSKYTDDPVYPTEGNAAYLQIANNLSELSTITGTKTFDSAVTLQSTLNMANSSAIQDAGNNAIEL